MRAALAELPHVREVTHTPGTDRFVVRHAGPLDGAARAVDRKIWLRFARRGLAWLAGQFNRPRADRGRRVMSIDLQTLIIVALAGYILGLLTALRLESKQR